MLQQALLTDADVERIQETALTTLERAGMMFQSERFLRALEAHGCEVDWPRERARIPRKLVQQVIDSEAASAPAAGTETPPSLPSPGVSGVGTQVAQLFYDHAQGRGRRPTRDDLIRMTHFGDALHRERGVGHSVIMQDVPQPIEPLEAQVLLIEHAHKPTSAYFYYAEQLEYAAEIGEIYCGNPKQFTGGGVFLTSPLRLCRRACNLMSKRIDMGFAAGGSNMPVAGASVPATMAGAIAVSAAEIQGAWTAYRCMVEGIPLSSGIAAGAVNMRTGNVSFCSPEAMMLNLGVAEFFRRLCGKRIGVAGASDYCDAKVPGLRAAFEKAHKAMTVAAYTGQHPGVGQGMLDSGKVLSPEQLLIERDVSKGVGRLFRAVDVSDDSLALESILEVEQGIESTHLVTEHTVRHFREALWDPEFHSHAPLDDYAADFTRDQRQVDKAHAQVEEIIETYEAPDVEDDMLRDLRKVVERAGKSVDGWDLG